MNKKEQLIFELMTKFEDIKMFGNSDGLLQRKTKVWEILQDTLPEDKEGDVIPIPQIGSDNYEGDVVEIKDNDNIAFEEGVKRGFEEGYQEGYNDGLKEKY